jgi:hypothetical protein
MFTLLPDHRQVVTFVLFSVISCIGTVYQCQCAAHLESKLKFAIFRYTIVLTSVIFSSPPLVLITDYLKLMPLLPNLSTSSLSVLFFLLQSVGTRVRQFRLKNCYAYKRNEAKLDPFRMCFTCLLEKISSIFSLRFN